MGKGSITSPPDRQALPGTLPKGLEAEITDLVRHFCPQEAEARRLVEEALRQTQEIVRAAGEDVLQHGQMRRMLFCLIHALMQARS
ncbi:hypothetical protein [Rhizobium sp. SL86]|uniref:hypothetical protein n=1 Tax=Rhizobium sp. SL86 TaxID=2995148 RepID=UPI00227523D0|nr:hypothetical protein [Rhizobium sp. SL86]MCY1668475.1 hypothetical protein [Rhizobium sp. SL86]